MHLCIECNWINFFIYREDIAENAEEIKDIKEMVFQILEYNEDVSYFTHI